MPLGYIVAGIVYLTLSYATLILTAFLGIMGLAIGLALLGAIAEQDIAIGEAQIGAAQAHVGVADQERQITQTQIT